MIGSSESQWEEPDIVKTVRKAEFQTRLATLLHLPGPDISPKQAVDPHVVKWDRAMTTTEDDLNKVVAEFTNMLENKRVSKHPNTSCHVIFARTMTEEDFVECLRNMGVKIIEQKAGGVEKTLPYCETGDGSASVPCFKVHWSATPKMSLTFEYNTLSSQPSVKGSRGLILQYIKRLLAFIGRVADIKAQGGARGQTTPCVVAPPQKAGAPRAASIVAGNKDLRNSIMSGI